MNDVTPVETTSGDTSVPHHRVGRLTLPRQVRDQETAYIDQRRKAAGVVSLDAVDGTPPPPLVGLCFSGGGIRSPRILSPISTHSW